MVEIKNELQYREFLMEVYPQLALKLSRVDLTASPDDFYSIYKMWCYNKGREE